ncbi:hypothetical protein AB1E18_015450 [Capra hircus]
MTPRMVKRSQSSWSLPSHWSPWRWPYGLRRDPEDYIYDLYAVCSHHGTMQGGHYTGLQHERPGTCADGPPDMLCLRQADAARGTPGQDSAGSSVSGFMAEKPWNLLEGQGDLPSPGIEPGSPALKAASLPCEPPRKPIREVRDLPDSGVKPASPESADEKTSTEGKVTSLLYELTLEPGPMLSFPTSCGSTRSSQQTSSQGWLA